MQLTIKTLLGLTLLVALLVNGLINHFAARSLQQDLNRDGYFSLPEREINLEQQILVRKRALEVSQRRRAECEKLGAMEAPTGDSQ